MAFVTNLCAMDVFTNTNFSIHLWWTDGKYVVGSWMTLWVGNIFARSYFPIVTHTLVATTPNYLPNIIQKDNTNTSQTLSMLTSPLNNKETLDTLTLPQQSHWHIFPVMNVTLKVTSKQIPTLSKHILTSLIYTKTMAGTSLPFPKLYYCGYGNNITKLKTPHTS